MKPLARHAATFGINVLAGIGLAFAVLAILLNFSTTPPQSPPKAITPAPIVRPAITAAPTHDDLTVVQLRTLARQQLGPHVRIGGRRIAQATRQQLLDALA